MRMSGGRAAFLVIWAGQLISLLGSGLTTFALSIWTFRVTGQAEPMAIVIFWKFVPTILLGPLTGVAADRYSRRMIMILANLGSGMVGLMMALLYAANRLDMSWVYWLTAISGICDAFHLPAYQASVTLLLPKEQYGRAGGLMGLAESAPRVMSPLLGGLALAAVKLAGVIAIDLATFVIAIVSLLAVHIPQPAPEPTAGSPIMSFWRETTYGFSFMLKNPGLRDLQLIFSGINLLFGCGAGIASALILARTGNDALMLAQVTSIGAIGGVAGSMLVSVWGGPARKIHGVLGGLIINSLLGRLLFGIGNGLIIWSLSAFLINASVYVINGSNQAIWQTKVAPSEQGRVFATRRLFAQLLYPVGLLLSGYLADRVFEPAMHAGGRMADAFGWLVGTSAGAGIALLLVATSVCGGALGLVGYVMRTVSSVEEGMPDHDLSPAPQAT